jgi:8-oxo-dGTP pyrophosphatase MutT (NUDIX family)
MPCETLDELAARLRERLGPGGGPLPGAAAQTRMAPRPRALPGDHDRLADAAVLILLYPAAAGTSLVLTRRTDTVASHRSQVSLPGGRRERDESLEEAALRECAEELGVDFRAVTVLGALSPLEVPVSGYRIQPVVGFAASRPAFVPDPAEVAEVIEVAVEELPSSVREETWAQGGRTREVPFYLVGGHKVWGATAMILSEMLAVIREGA